MLCPSGHREQPTRTGSIIHHHHHLHGPELVTENRAQLDQQSNSIESIPTTLNKALSCNPKLSPELTATRKQRPNLVGTHNTKKRSNYVPLPNGHFHSHHQSLVRHFQVTPQQPMRKTYVHKGIQGFPRTPWVFSQALYKCQVHAHSS